MPTIAGEANEIYRRRVLEARGSSPLERMWEGPRLFEMAYRITRTGAAHQVGKAGAEVEYQRRMAIAERLRPAQ